MCEMFPFQVMKIVRLRLKLVDTLLEDDDLEMRVLHLVRDPRGIIHSRQGLEWCRKNSMCSNLVNVCSDMVNDYHAAVEFSEKFPEQFL
jgi:hypothetical protein